jgi:arabinogalactan oligomer / maltooligosaccharide transport system substrate-binding protein
MEEFVTVGETIEAETDVNSAFYMRGDAYWLQPFLWAFGGGLFDVDDQGNVTEILVNNEGSVEGLTFLLDDVLGTIAPESVDFANDYGNAMTAFKAGQVAMIFNGPWSTADVLSGEEFTDPANLGIGVIPAGPGGDRGSPIGGHSYVVYAGMPTRRRRPAPSSSPATSALTENQGRLASELNLLPTRTSAYELSEVQDNPLIADFQAVIENATARPVVPEGGAIYAEFGPNFQAAWTGDKTPQQALDDVAAAWETLLASPPGAVEFLHRPGRVPARPGQHHRPDASPDPRKSGERCAIGCGSPTPSWRRCWSSWRSSCSTRSPSRSGRASPISIARTPPRSSARAASSSSGSTTTSAS